MAFHDKKTLESATGAALCMRHETAQGEPIGVVHILHGLAEHSARYGAFAQALSRAGYHVYAHDHRGHGFTHAPGAPEGVFDAGGHGADLVLEDVASIHDMIEATHPGLPLALFGHSMGGIIAMAYALRNPERLAAACGLERKSDDRTAVPGRQAGDRMGALPARLGRPLGAVAEADIRRMGPIGERPAHGFRLAEPDTGRGRCLYRRSAVRLAGDGRPVGRPVQAGGGRNECRQSAGGGKTVALQSRRGAAATLRPPLART